MNQAVQSGNAPVLGEAKPWVGNAILDALSKYEAMTKAHAQQPAARAPGPPRNLSDVSALAGRPPRG
ncbi:MAG: hypothetical protein ACPGQM_03470 [Alphaproteobacteria bacterium]